MGLVRTQDASLARGEVIHIPDPIDPGHFLNTVHAITVI